MPDSLPPEDFDETPKSRAAFWWTLLVLVIAAGLFTFFFGQPTYRSLKALRARQLATKAERYAQEQKWHEALQTAQAAYQLGATDARTLRMLAKLQEEMSPPEALELYLTLVKSKGATPDDLRSLGKLAVRLGQQQIAESTIRDLLTLEPANAKNFLLASNFSLMQNDLIAANAYAQRAWGLEPDNREIRLTVAKLSALDPKNRAESRKMLWALAIPGSDTVSLDALQILASMTDLPWEELKPITEALQRHPLARMPQQLLALQAKLRLDPATRDALLKTAIETYSRTMEDRLALARWLNQIKEYPRTLLVVPPTLALTNQNFFLVRLDAMAALNQWKEIETALDDSKAPLPPPIRELYRARCARELGQKEDSEARWDRAIAEAARDSNPNTLWYLAEYALRLNERAQAWKIFQRLAKNPVTARRAFPNLVRMAEEEADTPRLLEVIEQAAREYPNDPAPQNDVTYLHLLLDRDTPQFRASAQKLFDKQPQMMSFRVTLALALLRSGEPAQALQLFDAVSFPVQQLLPGWQAVYAAVLAKNGRMDDAKKVAALIPLDRLKPEERELIRGIR